MNAREEILSRIRTALGETQTNPSASHSTIARSFTRHGSLDAPSALHLLVDRLVDYDSTIIEVTREDELAAAIAQALADENETNCLVAPEFPSTWLPQNITFKVDHYLPTNDIEGIPAVVTTCELAVASTGTIFLVHEGAQGRRILTLLPDHHICLVRRDQVVETIPESFPLLAGKTTKPITTISGPSATSDIEMTRIKGVHGPRRLTVIFYG